MENSGDGVRQAKFIGEELRVDLKVLGLAGSLDLIKPRKWPVMSPCVSSDSCIRVSSILDTKLISVRRKIDEGEERSGTDATNEDDPRKPSIRIWSTHSVPKGGFVWPERHFAVLLKRDSYKNIASAEDSDKPYEIFECPVR